MLVTILSSILRTIPTMATLSQFVNFYTNTHGGSIRRSASAVSAILWISLLLSTSAQAQSGIQVTASVSETQVFQGERISFSVVISGSDFRNVGRPVVPDQFPGFRLLSLQPSTSTNYSIVNGVASRSYSYVYALVAETPGNYTFPAVSIQVDGENYTTAPVAVRVLARSNQSARGSSNARPDVFIRVELSEQSPVVGQQISADLVLYFKSPLEIVSYQPSSNWVTDGFWKELISDGSNPRAESVIIDNERYRRAVLLKHALFPSRPGNLTIGEARVAVTVRNPGRYNDPFSSFFGGFGTNQRNIDLVSDPVNVQVRPLPATEYTTIDAVGKFSITRRLSTPTAMVGEAVEIITEVRGTGNLALISRPKYEFPEGFEVFTPQEQTSINKESGEISGVRTFRDVVIVRRPGQFQIEPKTIVYYDPARRRYVNVNLPALILQVSRDENAVAASIQQRDLGVVAVTGIANWRPTRSVSVLSNWWLWAGLALPLIVLIVSWRMKSENDRMRGDVNYARRIRALDNALSTLDAASHLANTPNPDVKQVMSMVQNILYSVVADRKGIQMASLNDEKVISILKEHALDESSLREIQKTLNKCSTIRFAPVIGRENLHHEIDRTRVNVQKICEVLR